VLDSEEVPEEEDELGSADVDGVWVSVVFVVSAGVVVAGPVDPALVVASVCVACSVVWVWVGSASVVWVVVEDVVASGDREAALRAFVEPAEVVTRFAARSPLVEDFPFVSAPFVAARAVLPGKACAASSVKAPVSVAEPASNQRLQRARRRSAASRERLDGDGVMRSYSTPWPSIH
jgi:hypothetical protein